MSENNFRSITYFPNGGVYDSGDWNIVELLDECPNELSKPILLDSNKRKFTIRSPVGDLEVVWSWSHIFGVSTLLRNGRIVNTGLYMPGEDVAEELKLLRFYLDSWRNLSVVKELCGDEVPFASTENESFRPLLVSVNWATITQEEYDQIAYYDLFMASKYFQIIKGVN